MGLRAGIVETGPFVNFGGLLFAILVGGCASSETS